MNNYLIKVYDTENNEVDSFTQECKTAKGVEKVNKQRFKEYRKLNYSWKVEEIEC